MIIPKIVHVSWKSKTVVESAHQLITHGLRNVIDLNPDWDVTVHQDSDVDYYLKNMLLHNEFELIKHKHIVDKVDLWRLLKIYHEGGVYLDIDRLCNQPFSVLVQENTKWVVPTCRDYDFSHDFMMSAPQNPVYINAANLLLQRRKQGWDNTYFLGTQTYMHALTHTVFGQVINTDPGTDVFIAMRNQLDQLDYVNVIREDPPYNTAIYQNNNSFVNWEFYKRDFYASQGVRHWTNEW